MRIFNYDTIYNNVQQLYSKYIDDPHTYINRVVITSLL